MVFYLGCVYVVCVGFFALSWCDSPWMWEKCLSILCDKIKCIFYNSHIETKFQEEKVWM